MRKPLASMVVGLFAALSVAGCARVAGNVAGKAAFGAATSNSSIDFGIGLLVCIVALGVFGMSKAVE